MAESRPAEPPAGERLLRLVDDARRQAQELGASVAEASRHEFLGLVAAAIAHEVNNVLTPVRSYAELALARPGDRELAERALKAAAEGSERACLITEAMLECARGGAAEGWADIAAAAGRAARLIGPGSCHVQHTIPPGLAVAMPQVALEQVLLNLLLNAKTAAGAGGEIRVTARESGDGVEIEVEDNGRGIPADRLGRVFEAFESGSVRGRGLGLTICRYLVESVGGRIRAASEVGVGTRFTIELPAAGGAARAA
jgi:signal transduction histidine kinase